MSEQWIKVLGMGARGVPFPDDWTRFQNGFFLKSVTFPHRPSLRSGDGIIYHGAGWGLVFAVGTVTRDAYPVRDAWTESWPWVVDVALDHRREFVREGVPLDSLNVEQRDLRISIQRHSHIRLSEAEFGAATTLLR